MDYSVYLKPELLIVVAALVFIGWILKGLKKVPDEFIPVILIFIGIVASCLLLGGFTTVNVLQGVIAAACAVCGNQMKRQTEKYADKKISESEINVDYPTFEPNKKDVITQNKQEELKPPDSK